MGPTAIASAANQALVPVVETLGVASLRTIRLADERFGAVWSCSIPKPKVFVSLASKGGICGSDGVAHVLSKTPLFGHLSVICLRLCAFPPEENKPATCLRLRAGTVVKVGRRRQYRAYA